MRDEWHRRINHVDGYVHEITGEPLPNDDMDLQLVWLVALEEQGVSVDAGLLGDYWRNNDDSSSEKFWNIYRSYSKLS